jgi:hypothetical protein
LTLQKYLRAMSWNCKIATLWVGEEIFFVSGFPDDILICLSVLGVLKNINQEF